ncbi:MAG: chorismate mutase [Chitinispirillia bacterium]|jgi:chorismate mutase
MTVNIFDLSNIAAQLEGLEETIIYKLLDRAQFKTNRRAYKPGFSGFYGESKRCLFDIRLSSHETMDAKFGRFHVPEERPFTDNLPSSRRKVSLPPTQLAISDYDLVNVSGDIKKAYIELLATLCDDGDDGQYGSSVEYDVFAVQSIGRRIHFGALYVAESKFITSPAEYTELIRNRNENGLMEKLTRKDVEDRIISRVHEKICSIQSNVNRTVRRVIDPDIIVNFYREIIIPLTKKGEILYLVNRKLSCQYK